MLRDDRKVTGLPFSTDAFFQAAGDIDRASLAENQPQLRPKPRVSSLMSDARVIAYSMANTPKSNEQRENPDKVSDGYGQATGRLVEPLNHEAIKRVLPEGYLMLEMPLCIGHPSCLGKTGDGALVDHWATGHPDDLIVRPDGGLILVSYKLWGRFAYKEITLDGLFKRRDHRGHYTKGAELFAQEAAYGAGLEVPPVEVWYFLIAQDSSGTRYEFKQKQFAGKDPHPKGYLRAVEWEDISHCAPALEKRARWFSDWYKNDGDPTHVAMEKVCPENWRELPPVEAYPWGYTEYEDRAVADGQGTLVAPRPLPW